MSIHNLQKQNREIGIIRIGEKVETQGNKTRPAMLETFRFTSSNREALGFLATEYGGGIRNWEGHDGEYELYTEAKIIHVIVNAENSLTQWYETWAQGGCKVRCDGVTATLQDAQGRQSVPCRCNPEDRQCFLTTRLSVMLPKVPMLGTWRLNSKGKIFAGQVAAFIETLQQFGMANGFCFLTINQEEIKKPGQAPKYFSVPSLQIDTNPPNMHALIASVQASAMALPAPVKLHRHSGVGED